MCVKGIPKERSASWSFEPDQQQLILPNDSERGLADGTKTALEMNKENDIKSWTLRQVEYLLCRRAAFKGVVTKNSKTPDDIISKNGSRTVLRYVKERVCQALQNASQITQDVIALQSDNVSQRAESEEWLDNLRSEVEDIVDTIEEYLESRADEPPSYRRCFHSHRCN